MHIIHKSIFLIYTHYEIYKNKGCIYTKKFNTFYNDFIKNKHIEHLIILDNTRFHNL